MKTTLLFVFCSALSITLHSQNPTPYTCYNLNGNAIDAVHGYNGVTHLIKDTTDRFGNPHSAMYFNGITYANGVNDTSYVVLPDALKKQVFSVSLWVKPTRISPDGYILFAKNSLTSNHEGFCVGITNQSLQTSKNNANGINRAVSPYMLSDTQWTNIGVTASYDSLKLYTNGVLMKALATFSNIDYQTGKPLLMGSDRESYFDSPYVGAMDDLEFFDYKLTDGEMYNLFLNGSSCSQLAATTEIKSIANKGVSIYPNPANNVLNITYGINTPDINAELVDVLGRVLLTKSLPLSLSENTLEISTLNKGVYFVRIVNNGKVIDNLKFIKN